MNRTVKHLIKTVTAFHKRNPVQEFVTNSIVKCKRIVCNANVLKPSLNAQPWCSHLEHLFVLVQRKLDKMNLDRDKESDSRTLEEIRK